MLTWPYPNFEISTGCYTHIHVGCNGPDTKAEHLWADDDNGNCELLTHENLQRMIDETEQFYVKLKKLQINLAKKNP